MMPLSPSGSNHRTFSWVVAASIACAAGVGCSGALTTTGSGNADGGGGSSSDAGGCTPADCAGLAVLTLVKLCPDGTSVGETLCTREANGACGWGFPACPDDAGSACPGLGCDPQCPNGVLKDSNGCDTCQCAPASDAAAGSCTAANGCPSGYTCAFLESAGCSAAGQCVLAPGGVRCQIASAIGCGCSGNPVAIGPSCATGYPTGYASEPVLHPGPCAGDAGACVSMRGRRCGGNTT
ncbi:MAG: hypothetical protein ACREJ3_09095, partial [Polyangiaceae bacterium]